MRLRIPSRALSSAGSGGLLALALLASPSPLLEAGEAGEAALALLVYPPDAHLSAARDRQSLVVEAIYPDGLTRDVTAASKLVLQNPALARLERNVLYPQANGETQLQVEFGGRTVSIPVTVKDAQVDRPISFRLDVMPVFMKATAPPGGRTASASRSSVSTPPAITTASRGRSAGGGSTWPCPRRA
jgi:hypothetical protein